MVLDWSMSIWTHAHIKIDIHGWVREVMIVNQTRNYDPNQSQQANKLQYYASPSNGHACYVLWCVGWKCGVIPFRLTIGFGRKPHITTQVGKLELITSFIATRGQVRKSNKSTMLVGFLGLPHELKSCWKVMSTTMMHLLMVNWRCQGHMKW
jgi:hypothetical protein